MREYGTPNKSNFTGVVSTNVIPSMSYSTDEQFNQYTTTDLNLLTVSSDSHLFK